LPTKERNLSLFSLILERSCCSSRRTTGTGYWNASSHDLNSLGLGAWFVAIPPKLLYAIVVMRREEVVVVQKERSQSRDFSACSIIKVSWVDAIYSFMTCLHEQMQKIGVADSSLSWNIISATSHTLEYFYIFVRN
jgi:hypothetical protein